MADRDFSVDCNATYGPTVLAECCAHGLAFLLNAMCWGCKEVRVSGTTLHMVLTADAADVRIPLTCYGYIMGWQSAMRAQEIEVGY